jgi:hypothetical protein
MFAPPSEAADGCLLVPPAEMLADARIPANSGTSAPLACTVLRFDPIPNGATQKSDFAARTVRTDGIEIAAVNAAPSRLLPFPRLQALARLVADGGFGVAGAVSLS